MIRWCDNGHAPTRVQSGTRCPACVKARGRNHLRDAMREARRATPAERGYGTAHQAARRELIAMLPMTCAYGCGAVLRTGADMVAAHVVDGDASAGWQASCRTCNQRAMQRARVACARNEGGSRNVGRQGAVPAPSRSLASRTGLTGHEGPG